MTKKANATYKSGYAAICSIICWFAIICQLVLMIQNRVVPVPETLLRFFGFFTILTNIIVAITFTANIKKSPGFSFLRSFNTISAILVYILVVGIVYNVILRAIWAPTGMQKLVDELLHLAIPLLFLFYWITFTIKERVSWSNLGRWLVYPFIYLLFILISGSFTSFYPYPFVDVNNLGISVVLVNSGYMLLFFLALSSVFIFISKQKAKNATVRTFS